MRSPRQTPDMAPADWFTTGRPHVWLPYTQMKTAAPPIPVHATEGTRIILEDGRELIDGVASWWTACHGYNHPHIAEAVRAQLDRMPHVMLGGLAHEQAFRLAQRLADLLPGDLSRVFFSESGSVSVEIAMKMAVQYWINRGEQGRNRFVSFRGGYHGDTFATMSVCDPDEGMHTLFFGALARQHLADLPTTPERLAALDALLTEHQASLAGVLVEPLVQGAGGMVFHDAETLRALRDLCDRHGLLLIFDEIFTGFGRTGDLFACTGTGVTPDIITLSKALTGGTLPLAATVAGEHVYDAFHTDDPGACLMHGPTYMGNALACAAANAALDLFEREDRIGAARRIESGLRAGLAPAHAIPGVVDVRVKGAIGVIQVPDLPRLDALKRAFVEAGVWIRPFNGVIYTTPALTISDEDLGTLTRAMVSVTAAWASTAE